ncbi:MAG: TetR/AcrR family transcriptional regulator [Bacteroidales bacterium]|nr:TetR/AcrR family transcriptional regulator [Bacteroidales bacterium]
MPKDTFINLKEDKKQRLKEAFLKEFTMNAYDDASITTVVKKLGIAKGSIYQYFNDKLDLYMYLINECSLVKMKYIQQLDRKNFTDFWEYFRRMYECGYQFDIENPLESHFLHRLVQNINSPSVKSLYDEMMKQSAEAFNKMVEHEVNLELFRNDIPIKVMGFMLYKVGISIMEQMEYAGIINPLESIDNNLPVYQGKKNELTTMVDNYIKLVRESFDNKNNYD